MGYDFNTLDDIRKKSIEYELSQFDEDERQVAESSQYKRYLERITSSAMAYAREKNIDPSDSDWQLVNPAISVVSTLRNSLVKPEETDPKKKFFLWLRDDFSNPIRKIKLKDTPYIDRQGIEVVVSEYLELPFRCSHIDRLLADILIAMELYAFGDEMVNEVKLPLFPPRSPLKQPHPFWNFIKGQFSNGFLFIGGAILLMSIVDAAWAFYLGVFLIGVFFIFFFVALLYLPSVWIKYSKAKSEVLDLLIGMNSLYTELKSDGPISPRHIRERAQSLSAKGVIWPAPLFVLLDDVIDRKANL